MCRGSTPPHGAGVDIILGSSRSSSRAAAAAAAAATTAARGARERAGILTLPWGMAGASVVVSVVLVLLVVGLNGFTVILLVHAAETHKKLDLGALALHAAWQVVWARVGSRMQRARVGYAVDDACGLYYRRARLPYAARSSELRAVKSVGVGCVEPFPKL